MKKEITIIKMLKNFLKKEETRIEDNRTVWVILSDQIDELYEKVREIYYLGQTDLADSFKVRIDKLRENYKEELTNENNDITSHDFDDTITGIIELRGEINDYLNGEGKVLENRRISERYYKKIEEILTNLDEKSTEKLWAETTKIAEELKFDCERNPRLEAQQFNRIIAKLVLQILRIQAKRGEEIDVPQAEELCSKEDLLCAIKNKLIEMSKQEQSEVKKEKYLDTARYLDEKSLQNPEVWQSLSGVQKIKFVGVEEKKPKKEIEIKKPRFCLPQIKYEGLGLEKFPWISVYTLGDIDEKTGEWINVEKKYGSFPRDFGDENDRVLEIEIKGAEEFRHSIDYRNLRKVILGDSVKCIGAEVFEGLYFLEDVEFGKGIEHIGHLCFSCTALKNIYLPSSIKTIYPLAFSGCKKLESIEIGGGKKEISNDAFWGTPAWLNGNVKISDNTEIIGDFSIFTLGEIDQETGERKNVRRVLGRGDKYRDQVLEIEINGVSRITEGYQLKYYPNLEKVVLRENVGEIGERAFAECHKLKEVITDYDTSIDENAFEGCHQKVKITYFSEDEKIGKHFIENLRIVNSLIDDER